MSHFINHLYIVSTVLFTVYSQLVMRWQVSIAGDIPADFLGKVYFIGHLFLNPWVFSGIIATLFAGISWMLVMTRFEISYAYPWISINFVLMLAFGVILFNESINLQKLTGTLLVMAGLIVIARS